MISLEARFNVSSNVLFLFSITSGGVMRGSYANHEARQGIEPSYVASPLLKFIRYNDS